VRGLDRVFRPRRIALIGASPNPRSVAGTVLRNPVGSGFQGVSALRGSGSPPEAPTAPARAGAVALGSLSYSPYFSMICCLVSPRMPYLAPTFLKASMPWSRWCCSWAADSWVRMRAWPLGTTGKKKPTT
jgi:hypothetical protein